MKIKKIITLTLIAAAILTMATGCRDGAKKQFDRLAVELADRDGDIDADDWAKMKRFLEDNRAKMDDFFDGDNIDSEDVKEYIAELFANRRPPKEITFSGISDSPVTVDIWLERSGSMAGYDNRQTDGNFKATIVDVINNAPVTPEIYVVNSSVNKYPEGAGQFIGDSDVFTATKGIGDASYTDFRKIFDQLLNQNGENRISLLFTDMIYSTRNMAGVNPEKVFAEAKGMVSSVFKSQCEDKSILVVKMNSKFVGSYFSFNNAETQYSGNRPFYIFAVADNDVMARLATDKNLAPMANFSSMNGFESMYLFTAEDIYKPHYSLLLGHNDIRGRFKASRGQKDAITELDDVDIDENSGDLQLVMAVDLSGMLIPESYLTDKRNYSVESDDEVTIKEIRPLDANKDLTQVERKYAATATHLFVLQMKKIRNDQDVSISLQNNFPDWINASSTDNDTTPDDSHTFGLKYIMQGIYDAYKRQSDGKQAYFKMKIELNE